MTSQLVSMRRVAGASVVNLFYLAIQSLVFILITPLLLKFWGADKFGIWMVMLAITRVAILIVIGIHTSVVKFVSQFSVESNAGEKISATITFGLLFSASTGFVACMLLWLLRGQIAELVSPAGDIASTSIALGLIALGLIPAFLSRIPEGVLYGLIRNEIAGALTLAYDFFLWIGALLIGAYHGTLPQLGWWILCINLGYLVLTASITFSYVRSIGLHWTLDNSINRSMLHYSFYAYVMSLGTGVFQQFDRILVGLLLGSAIAGVYSIASGIATRLTSLAYQFTQVLLPFASSYQVKDRKTVIVATFRHALVLVSCLMVLAASLSVIWMKEILTLWISPQFSTDYWMEFSMLIIIYALIALALPGLRIALGMGWIKFPTIIIVVSSIVMLLALWLLSRFYGLYGAIVANFLFVSVVSINFYTASKLGLQPLKTVLRDVGPPFLLLLLLIALQIQNADIFIKICTSLSVVVLLTWLALSGNRVQLIQKMLRAG